MKLCGNSRSRIDWFMIAVTLWSNSSAIGVEWIYNRTSVIHPVVEFGHRDPNLLVPLYCLPSDFVVFPLVVFLPAGSRVIYSMLCCC